MKIYEATYPWFVRPGNGSMSICYPKLKLLRQHVKEMVLKCAAETPDALSQFTHGMAGDKKRAVKIAVPVRAAELTVAKLTAAAFCEVVNSQGGSYVENRKELPDVVVKVTVELEANTPLFGDPEPAATPGPPAAAAVDGNGEGVDLGG